MRIVANVKVGKAKVHLTAPSHIPGVRQGNKKHSARFTKGLHPRGKTIKATAARSTGVNSLLHNSIVPGAPRLTPM